MGQGLRKVVDWLIEKKERGKKNKVTEMKTKCRQIRATDRQPVKVNHQTNQSGWGKESGNMRSV